MSQSAADMPHWPPRSPLDALKSTPGGRERLRRLAERTSPSPSPSKRDRQTPGRDRQYGAAASADLNDDNEDEDEDEETLQLKLQEIQARLKLKKLQKAKAGGGDDVAGIPRSGTALNLRANSSAAIHGRSNISGLREERQERARSQASIHVPVSPVRKVQAPEPTRSPSRVLLGIDKGLRGCDVSLKRPPTLRKPTDALMENVKRAGGYLQRSRSPMANDDPFAPVPSTSQSQSRPATSFSERMAKVRDQETTQKETDARIKRLRSRAFDIDARQMEDFKSAAVPLPEVRPQVPEFSRDQVLGLQGTGGGTLQKSKSTSYLSSTSRNVSGSTASTLAQSTDSQPSSQLGPKSSASSIQSMPSSSQTDPVEFESFSSLHLSKRIIPHSVLSRTLAGKKIFTLPDLLRDVKAPDFRLPDIEEDIVVLAVLASKSDPKPQKNGATKGQKFMIQCLCDLKWEVDLFLFDTGFQKYWKLTTGTVVAILNPTIMKPVKTDTGRFSLVINSSDDTILEIGTARDLGYCKSIKKDGNACSTWVDKRRTEYCEYHVNETLKKTKASRMEVSTMDFDYKAGKRGGGQGGRRNNDIYNHSQRRSELLKKNQTVAYDRGTQSTMYVHRGGEAHFEGEAGEKMQKAQRMRQRLAEKEKERDLQKQLANLGGGLGAEYMRIGSGSQQQESEADLWEPEARPDAKQLGLLGGKASDMSLGPVKRKRTGTNSTSSSAAAVGWGGQLTKELGRMKDGERLQPVKKKTRFVTAKGIREAGRESFGGEAAKGLFDDDDDDDDLEIIK
ncbi:hypothetical protein V496_01507 [Pseudogymnoascus sp. VKM F-4515 (FW-2607)]|nr:hypothetical protein V496_01507 [Pseudogymnoascus sp. VKM F-4515 (FW-2607)]